MVTSIGSKSIVFLFVVLFHIGCAGKTENQRLAPSEHEEFTEYMVEGQKLLQPKTAPIVINTMEKDWGGCSPL